MKIKSLTIKWSVTCLLISIGFTAMSQKVQRLYDDAEEALAREDYKTALSEYQEVSVIDPQFESTEYKMELCSLMLDSEYSIEKYQDLEETYGNDEHYYYWLAKAYMKRYRFEDAAEALNQFHQKVAYNGNDEGEEIEKMLESTNHLLAFFNNPDNYEIHQLDEPINSIGDELSPVYFEEKKELLFASSRGSIYPVEYKIYYAKKGDNGWGSLTEVRNLGTFSESTANIEVVNQDGKLFLFREENGGDLYFSQPSGDNWTYPVEFDSRISNNDLHSHFYINEHEDRIIFSTEDKTNGLEIYESYMDPEKNKWTRPAPFSVSINTEFNEDSPYLSPDEKSFYFVSDRPGGLGGLDVYVSNFDEANFTWSKPKNLGWPINSPDNEFHFKMNEDQTSGYYVSDRIHSKGQYDIYFFWEVEKVKITGRLIDQEGKPLANAQIRFHPSQYLDEYFHSTSNSSGVYSTKIISDETFNVEILVGDRVIYNDRFEVHDAQGQPITHHKDFRIH